MNQIRDFGWQEYVRERQRLGGEVVRRGTILARDRAFVDPQRVIDYMMRAYEGGWWAKSATWTPGGGKQVETEKRLTMGGLIAAFCLLFDKDKSDIGINYSYLRSLDQVAVTTTTKTKQAAGSSKTFSNAWGSMVHSWVLGEKSPWSAPNAMFDAFYLVDDHAINLLNAFGATDSFADGFFIVDIRSSLYDTADPVAIRDASLGLWDKRILRLQELVDGVLTYLIHQQAAVDAENAQVDEQGSSSAWIGWVLVAAALGTAGYYLSKRLGGGHAR
jgi:hypothetical protein